MAVPINGSDHETARSLAAAVEMVMNPDASNEERQQAHKICEDFKENSKIALPCGLQLAEKGNSAVVRHFGLQLVEHCVKYRWADIPESDGDRLQMNTLTLIDQGTLDMLVEERHIKDGISRILSELMKRVWPQKWSTLFTDFTLLCQKGPTQTELVLQTLLRFVEDVICFQQLPQHRRQDLRIALTQAMASIFSFLTFVLKKHLEIYRAESGETKERSLRVCRSVLETLSGFVDWVMVVHIQESELIPFLCSLLVDEDTKLCLNAAECLLLIVGRKGKPSERAPMMVIFQEEPMTLLLQAANNATEHITESNNFIFLKRLCEILLETGKQLGVLWGTPELDGQPPNFEMYLKALVAFTQHPSQSLRQMIYLVWMVFLRHTLISKDPLFQAVIPNLVQSGTVCLHKVGFPSQNNSISCYYSKLEFDVDEEFNVVLSNLRVVVGDTIRMITRMYPKLTFSVASSWVIENLEKPIDIGAGSGKNVEQGICNLRSPSFIAWDACSVYLEAVMSKMFLAEGEQPSVECGTELLYRLLDYEVQDPLILSSVLSCISALFPYLNYTPEAARKIVTKIFGAVQFSLPGQTKSRRSQAVKNVRTHACSVLVKVCKNYTRLFMTEFDHLYDCMKQLDLDPDQLSQMEKIILLEALIIISNNFYDFSKQSAFIEEIFVPIKQLWSSEDIAKAFSSPDSFMSYVGLNQAAVEPSSADICGINRSHILYCINTMYAVIKRSACPSEYSVALAGGFIVDSPQGKVMRNPATSHVTPLLNNLVQLIKTTSCLYKPEYISLLHKDFIKAYDMMDHDRQNYLGIPPAWVDNSDTLVYRHPIERMKNFITAVFESGFFILGNACICMGPDFYSTPGLAAGIGENILNYFSLLPDFRHKIFIRNFIKLFAQNCPKEDYQTVIIPVLTNLCPQVLQRLTERWQQIKQRIDEMAEGDNEEEENPESQVLEMQVVRSYTKEYLDLLQIILLGNAAETEVKEEQDMEEDGEATSQPKLQMDKQAVNELSTLGLCITVTPELWPTVVMTILTGFSWPDTHSCIRCAKLILPLCCELIAKGQLPPEAVQHVFTTILSSLQVHGNTESTQISLLTLGMFFYERHREEFPCLREVLFQVPNVEKEMIEGLEAMIVTPPKSHPDKKKRDRFKKIVSALIAKDVSQWFQRAVEFSNLPRLFLESRRLKYPRLDESQNGETMGLCELFGHNATE